MSKLSNNRGIRIDVPVLSVSWSAVDHSVIIQALTKGLIEREASDTGGVPGWKSSCPDRLAEATDRCQPLTTVKHQRRNVVLRVRGCRMTKVVLYRHSLPGCKHNKAYFFVIYL